MGVLVETWGDFACFTRPEMKVERVTYPVMTPSAARGILTSIYWHPGMRWVVDRILVCNPIRYKTYTTNEVNTRGPSAEALYKALLAGKPICVDAQKAHTPRHNVILRDVRYVIDAHFELDEAHNTPNTQIKYGSIIERRLKNGQSYRDVCFGIREYAANFRLCTKLPEVDKSLMGVHDLDYMLYDMVYYDDMPQNLRPRDEFARPAYYHAVMKDGWINVPAWDDPEVRL